MPRCPERAKNLGSPDESIRFPGVTEDIVEIGDYTVGRAVQAAGWRWSRDMQPHVGGEWCEARHIGVVISGRQGVILRDGSVHEWGPDDVYDIPAGHDGYTVGDEPCVMIEWSGIRTWTGLRAGTSGRVLATLLFTDLVGSTATAQRLGDVAWREVLSRHLQGCRSHVERMGGTEIATAGDGLLVTFVGPALALRCAAAIVRSSVEEGLNVRAGVHVGEVEVVGSDTRGVVVHEAARVMAAAAPDEVLVSETARSLAASAGFRFEDTGEHELKGLDGPRRLYAYVDQPLGPSLRDDAG